MALAARYLPPDYFTVEEYLKYEETAETKHEYADGKIIAMAGSSLPHNDIARNVTVEMEIQFRNRPCRAYISDIRVRVRPAKFRYPDVIALCETPITDNSKPPCLLNPQVIVEVLSDSTERIDLITKLEEYSRLASVTDYIIIAQDRWWVMHYARENGGQWTADLLTEPGATLNIASIGVSMTLKAVYHNVDLEAAPSSDE